MSANILNFVLVLSIGLNTVLIWILGKQKPRRPALLIIAYLLFLFNLDLCGALYLLNSVEAEHIRLIARARLALQCFILPIFLYLISKFTLTRHFPSPGIRHFITFGVAVVMATVSLQQGIFEEIVEFNGKPYPGFDPLLLAPAIFFAVMLLLIVMDTAKKQKFYSGFETIPVSRNGSLLRMAGIALLLFIVYTLSYLPGAAWLLSAYFVISLLLFFTIFESRLIELTEPAGFLLSQMAVSSLVLGLFFITFDDSRQLTPIFLAIPAYLILVAVGHYTHRLTLSFLRTAKSGSNEQMDEQVDQFLTEIGKCVDLDELWQQLVRFLNETFDFSRIAVITLQYDISPYQIAYLDGFTEKNVESFINNSTSPFLQKLENDQQIINRFDYTPSTDIFREMERLAATLGIPLRTQKELVGIILLGDQWQVAPIPKRQSYLLGIIAAQIGITVANIQAIQKTVQSQKLASIGMFTSQLAHDFRSFISLVKINNSKNKRILRHAGYMEKLVQDLMNYARPQELKRNDVNINQLIDMSLDMIDIPDSVSVEKYYTNDLPRISVDTNQMRRVFINLIENSVRALELNEGKRIKITTKTLRSQSNVTRTPWMYVEVLDDGIGIPEEDLNRIFTPFFTTYKKQGGNGLGLATVQQIIARHSGFIDVTSKPGKGTAFNIRLPYQPA